MTIDNELIEKIALKVARTGTDKTNFKILGMLPSDINTMMKEFNLTKVPINIRINQLEKVGLVNRWRGTGIVVLTEFGKDFMKLIYGYQDIVRPNIMDMLKKISDS
jgi:DNA-binding GntR family transcriptional regulator